MRLDELLNRHSHVSDSAIAKLALDSLCSVFFFELCQTHNESPDKPAW